MAKKKDKVEGTDDGGGRAEGTTAVTTAAPFTDALRVGEGFVLAGVDPRSTPAFDGDKEAGKAALAAADEELDHLQEQLFAMSRAGGSRRVLLVIQGMDTSGKGGIMRHVVGSVDPQGVELTAFKQPTAEERRHPFLWRIRRALPGPGMIGVFDRSHYEDVLVVRVHDLVPPAQWKRRYGTINTFEKGLVEDDVTLVKVMLHISPDEQKARLQERLDRPDKHWKYNPGDLDERARWDDYQEAYQALLERCSPEHAPWYVVPADRKWYARLAVQQLLLEHLRGLDLRWPAADFDVEGEKERLTGL
ncbi:PPK2 family polyphosphate kinase [Ornithinimicrobium cerasi]|uniref:Polyphosphate:nucleotide phosphotransferase, PPK2 family n=1 Tax=Ornithinimicrobium cerasi TaxID=2248773 RepID=A0A285VAX4_9MICO|nr:PPK2 family polyphosphate kinase [Ornithinimicrobium cerasi]SOC51239.1 polyphosphate:nucleotide phosphotransferase, PPK2 family [Ornithinimicrobium cerasi]